MNTKIKKIEAIAITAILTISVFAGVMIAMAQPTATPEDAGTGNVVPGETYIAYNITFVANSTDLYPTNLSWFNISDMNSTISNMGNVYDIANISVFLNTTGGNIVNYSLSTLPMPPTTFPIYLNLSNATYTSGIPITNTSTVNLTINITINESAPMDTWDGTNIAIDATLKYWGNESNPWTYTNTTNDPAPELIVYEEQDADWRTASISLDSDTYGTSSTATIRVYDENYNKFSDSKQAIVAHAWSTFLGDGTNNTMNVTLIETGVNTNEFNGTMTFSVAATHDETNAILAVRGGNTIYVEFKDTQDGGADVATMNDTATIELTNTGTVEFNRTVYNTSNTALVTVDDNDLNINDGAPDTVDVTINSTQNLTAAYDENITLTLTETQDTSGVFTGTFNFSTTVNSSGSTLLVNGSTTAIVYDTITATYIDARNASYLQNTTTDTAEFNNTHTGTVSLNKTVYTDGDPINVTLYDPDLNTNISAIDWVLNPSNYTIMLINTTNLTAYAEDPSIFDSENITNITETEIDTGYFTNMTVNMSTNSYWGGKDNGTLYVTPGDSFAVVYFDFCDGYGLNHSNNATLGYVNRSTANATASTLQTADVSVWWNESGNITGSVINVTEDNVWGRDTVARISIVDADGGGIELSSTIKDTIYVLVNSTAPNAGQINISLNETDVNSGIFNGTLMFGTTSIEDNRVIKVNSSDDELINTTIYVNFNDTTNATVGAEWKNVSFTHWWTVNGTAKVYNEIAWGTPTSNVIFYNTTTATVQVTDSDRNANSSDYDTFSVTMVSWNVTIGQIDTLTLILNETGNNTGSFSNATLNFSEVEWGLPTKLNVSDGCSINVSYQDTNTTLGNVSTWFNYTYGTYKKTRNGTVGLWKLNPTVGESGNITLTDYDRNVTAGYDTVNVVVWSNTSEAESETITVTLNQTTLGATTFNGTLNFSTTETKDTIDQIKVSDGDNITIQYVDPLNISGLQKTITNSSAWVTTHYTGVLSWNESIYRLSEATALITLDDKDLNTHTDVLDSQNVTVNSTKHQAGFEVTLVETGINTGVFDRTVTLSTTASADPASRTLNVSIGDTINVTYLDALTATGDPDVNITKNATIAKSAVDSLTLDKGEYNVTDTVTANITDSDLNKDPNAIDVYYGEGPSYSNVKVNSSADTNGFNVSIQETGLDTGVFEVDFTLNLTTSDAATKVLKVARGGNINVTYINTFNETGQQETLVATASVEAATFDVNIDPSNITVNVSTTVTVNVTNATDAGAVVEGATVNLTGCGYTNETTTNATGIATFDVNASETGDISVTVNKTGYTMWTDADGIEVKEEYAKGDVNGDGSVLPSDAQAVLRIWAGIDTAADYTGASADVNGDGSILPSDAQEILRIWAGVI